MSTISVRGRELFIRFSYYRQIHYIYPLTYIFQFDYFSILNYRYRFKYLQTYFPESVSPTNSLGTPE